MNRSTFIASLHGLRGVAALLVIYSAGHGGGYIGLPGSNYSGSMGVSLFFVLSGFLMAYLYLPQDWSWPNVKLYAVARFARIYPLFAFVVLLSGLMYSFFSSWPFKLGGEDIVKHLLGAGDATTIWTISTEIQFYFFFILLWWLHTRFTEKRDFRLTIVLTLIIAASAIYGYSDDRIALVGYVHIFLIGMLAAIGYRNFDKFSYKSQIRLVAPLLAPVGVVIWMIAAYLASSYWGNRWIFQVEWLMALTGIIVFFSCISPDSLWFKFLSNKTMVWLGEISFGVYLLHRPVIWLLENIFPILNDFFWPVRAIVFTVILFGFAHLAYVLLEAPARRFIRKQE